MSHRTYFDHNENLQIHGDVTFVSTGGSTQDDHNFLQISQRVQATNTHSRTIEQGLKLLCKNTAPSARYGSGHSFTGPQCHPGTRIAVQDHIFKWLDDEDGQIAMWMNGPVGIGKSAIAQIVAHLAAERGQLSSAFFFFRSDETRNSAKYLVPTLAYEMTQQMPHTLDCVCQTAGANRLIFSSPLEHQINEVLLRPLCLPFESSPRGCRLIIIDGLDECLDTNTQEVVIRLFISNLLLEAARLIPHKLLIVSRPESQIASAFAATDIIPHVKHLALDPWDTEDDIGIFLRGKLDEIKETHPLRRYLPTLWPEDALFRRLREKSVGSFAYASVAVRYLASHNNNPEHALQDLLVLEPRRAGAAGAFADLDALYRHILLSLSPEVLFTVQKVLCLYVYCDENIIQFLAACLLVDISIVEIALIRVSSLVEIYNLSNRQYLKFHHSSFEEFLRDKERSRELYLFSANVASAVATALSSLWMHQIHDENEYYWFFRMSAGVNSTQNMDMTAHILATLAATKIPVSFLPVNVQLFSQQYAADLVADFFQAIQWRSAQDSNSVYRPLYNQAFNVVCAWLRLQFNISYQGIAIQKDVGLLDDIMAHLHILNIFSNDMHPSFIIFCRLAKADSNLYYLFDIIWRMFPEMDCREIFSVILEKYLTLSSFERIMDIASCFETKKPITLTRLYHFVLGHHNAIIPSCCQILEKIVMVGREAFCPFPSQYISSEACIFRFLYGDACCINREYQLAIWNKTVSDIITEEGYPGGPVSMCFRLAKKTDQYIRRVHADFDFAYISEGVESLYRSKNL